MEFDNLIKRRRSYRSIDSIEITEETINILSEAAKMAPSCYNNQPWKYIFITDNLQLTRIKSFLSKGNSWAKKASMIIAVLSKKEDDCIVQDREYFLFDTGMSCAFLQLKAVEIGLTIHPIAGYKEKEIKETLKVPENYSLITLLIVGQFSEEIFSSLSEIEKEKELSRPLRKDFSEFCYINEFRDI